MSGIEISRISTNTVASEPSATTIRLSGTDGGVSIPARRSQKSASTISPMKKTSLPRMPVFQPVTAIVRPSPEPVYQPMNAESIITVAAIHCTRSPSSQ